MGNVLPEPTDLAVAARVAQLLLAEHERVDHTDVFALNRAHGALTEALRLMLRAVGAEPLRPAVTALHRLCRDDYISNAHHRVQDHQAAALTENATEAVAATMVLTVRCPAAHGDDPTPCTGPPAVTVLDAQNAGADGCAHHGARLLASLDGGRVYALPDAPAGTAIRVFKAAQDIRPFPWIDGPRTQPSQLSHAETRGEGQ
jgi:hypothetical protein